MASARSPREGIYAAVTLQWQPYGTGERNTGVQAFAFTQDVLLLMFQGGEIYLYDEERPGKLHVAKMRELAEAGKGLSTYISRHIGDAYSMKFKRDELEGMLRNL